MVRARMCLAVGVASLAAGVVVLFMAVVQIVGS
jgi:hypothetical protein